MTRRVVMLGVFNADTTYRAQRLPRMGETIMGTGFALGPGGKGSNQAVAAGRLGADVRFLTRLGRDDFAEMARAIWRGANVMPMVIEDADSHTGAALIFVEDGTRDNAIIVAPGAAARMTEADIETWGAEIDGAAVFLTGHEAPLAPVLAGLRRARAAGAATILNPAPATPLPKDALALCDYITPNESEAEALTGLPVASLDEARAAAARLREMGAGCVVMTLGARGVLFNDGAVSEVIPAVTAGDVVETTGAGDAFNGAFVAGLAEGRTPIEAARHGCVVAGISVTRPGAAASMPTAAEVAAFVEAQG
ncbi:ribokinase [Anianabacter salinae]|uniref:ribokinase n=1 Tax=Anianabacter salinae TaxID=2851023 RepID=UPI00225DD3CB|nr:ribokinase [Anianabacter salinae]MBV0913911.1 ribokinase [Anianabacter salinae]